MNKLLWSKYNTESTGKKSKKWWLSQHPCPNRKKNEKKYMYVWEISNLTS